MLSLTAMPSNVELPDPAGGFLYVWLAVFAVSPAFKDFTIIVNYRTSACMNSISLRTNSSPIDTRSIPLKRLRW